MLCLSPDVRVKNPKSEILFDFCRFRAWWHLAVLEFAQYPDSLPLFLLTLLYAAAISFLTLACVALPGSFLLNLVKSFTSDEHYLHQ
jgi:hypothetical protein